MATTSILRGFATVTYYAADLAAAKKWYSELLGTDPYFAFPNAEKPAYIEFRIGDYQHELGLIDSNYKPKAATAGPGGEIIYWHVDDIKNSFQRLLDLGAKEYEPIIERTGGFVTASVIDPFGNILGIMYNPHYLETLNAIRKA